ncbi:unnamed protein product [Brassicogethes aeneus]|uniref:BOS complex subunit NCLN n=1 Tax=Brassicogethes aeneus TaxID=1431903 RepID=A0A9P0AYP0_BRAAE|nr:unnamed protein product [Brassicogethes aeneus]
MWLEEVEEIFKGYLPYYVLVFLPIFIIISPANPVSASHEFPVYRMQHFDLHGVPHGCRSSNINLEARSVSGWSTSRHCVVAKLQDLTVDNFKSICTKAGALIIVLPHNVDKLKDEDYQHLLLLENAMLEEEISIPVYFSNWTPELDTVTTELLSNIDSNDLTKSAAENIISSVAANGYQVVVSTNNPSIKNDVKLATIHGHLQGYGSNGKIPTIAIVAHYDSFGVAPDLSYGADSNGSGVIILLELVRLFSHLYSDQKTRGKYNILFILSGGGKLNYAGSKKWLEDQIESNEGSIIQEASFVMCLDTLAAGDTLYMHVSKPPKEGSHSSQFLKDLKASAELRQPVTVEGVHKKINLADSLLAWEHERYSIKRLPAFTMSTLKNHRDFQRGTILDTKSRLSVERLTRNTKVIAEALASHIYNISNGDLFGQSLDVSKDYVETWLNYLSTQPRSPQLLSNKENPLVNYLKDNLGKNLRDVKITYTIPDKRDPSFQFYEVTKGTMNIYSVKPAVFDLILTLAIVMYLAVAYFAISYFPNMYNAACTLTAKKMQ